MAEERDFGLVHAAVGDDGVAVVTLNRFEKRNALNAEIRQDLLAALDALKTDDAARVLVLTGAGDKAFAAGADVNELAERSTWAQREFITPPHVYSVIADYPKPVIAAVNGLALGAGCELAMACDVRVAAPGARLGQPEINLGIIPGGGGTQRLPRLVGAGRAARMVLTGEWIDAPTALAWGLVDAVAESDDALMGLAREMAAKMATKSPVALRVAKQALRAAEELPLGDGLAREIDLFTLAFQSADAKEGITAFRESRKPAWTGR